MGKLILKKNYVKKGERVDPGHLAGLDDDGVACGQGGEREEEDLLCGEIPWQQRPKGVFGG